MVETIKEELKQLEKQHNINILYCCESGSRAWGFPSPDSDFDVRFIYARKTNAYLSITEIKDVIDLPVNDLLDIGGWDIKKALKLFLKSNAPLYEWLQSPIIYQNESGFADELKRLMPVYYSLRSGANHYLSITYNTFTDDLQNEQVKIKRYFYAFRSILACFWIIKKGTVPPMEFDTLRVLIDDESINYNLDELLKKKLVSDEKTFITPIKVLNEWLDQSISDCKEKISLLPSTQIQSDELNSIFRRYISE